MYRISNGCGTYEEFDYEPKESDIINFFYESGGYIEEIEENEESDEE